MEFVALSAMGPGWLGGPVQIAKTDSKAGCLAKHAVVVQQGAAVGGCWVGAIELRQGSLETCFTR